MFQVIILLFGIVTITKAGPLGHSVVNVKHVGKDFSYSIEETHGIGPDDPVVIQQHMPVMPLVPVASTTKSEIRTSVLDSSESQQKESVDKQDSADPTVQIVPDVMALSQLQFQIVPDVTAFSESQESRMAAKNSEIEDPKNKSELYPNIMSPDSSVEVANPIHKEYQVKQIIIGPLTKKMKNFGVQDIHDQKENTVKVVYPSYRMHNGFRYYEPISYFYPFGVLRLV